MRSALKEVIELDPKGKTEQHKKKIRIRFRLNPLVANNTMLMRILLSK